MSRKLLLSLLVLIAFGLFATGCDLESDEEADVLPTYGVGETFKIEVDDIGQYEELDEAGQPTGRLGMWFDTDNDGFIYDQFFQLNKPTAGIVAIGFSDEGTSDSVQPVAMAKLEPGKTYYEVPLETLKDWVKSDVVLGYLPGQYMDDPDMLVYRDKVTGNDDQAPMTGEKKTETYRFESLIPGAITIPSAYKSGQNACSEDDGEDLDTEGLEARYGGFGEPFDSKCNSWEDVCKAEYDLGLYADGWGYYNCLRRMYYMYGTPGGNRYVSCLVDAIGSSDYQGYKNWCRNNLQDYYGWEGTYGPDVMDAFFVMEKVTVTDEAAGAYDSEIIIPELDEDIEISGRDRLALFIDYADVEGNMTGGYITVSVDGQAAGFIDLPGGLGNSSADTKKYIGFTFENPMPVGLHTVFVSMTDCNRDEISLKPEHENFTCRALAELSDYEGILKTRIGERPFTGTFKVTDSQPYPNPEPAPIGFSREIEFYETYAAGINKYNLGKGFIDVLALGWDFNYELTSDKLAIIQGGFWGMHNSHDLGFFTWQDGVQNRFSTPYNARHTKFDYRDDVEAAAIYVDQPMSAGRFSFYGDTGWNIYPLAPGSSMTEDQPFIKGDFETTVIYLPTHPMTTVNPKYNGCTSSCDYWMNKAWQDYSVFGRPAKDFAIKNSSSNTSYYAWAESLCDDMSKEQIVDEEGNTTNKMAAFYGTATACILDVGEQLTKKDCSENMTNNYWQCRIHCWNLAEGRFNGCQSLDECIDTCSTDPYEAGSAQNWCEDNGEVIMKMRLRIPEEYLDNCFYKKKIFGPPEDANGANGPVVVDNPYGEMTRDCEWTYEEKQEWVDGNKLMIGIAYFPTGEWYFGELVKGDDPDYIYEVSLPYGKQLPRTHFYSHNATSEAEAFYMAAAFNKEGVLGTSFYPADEMYEYNWYWYVWYTYGFETNDLEGWAIAQIRATGSTGYLYKASLTQNIIDITFGDLRAYQDDNILDPDATI